MKVPKNALIPISQLKTRIGFLVLAETKPTS